MTSRAAIALVTPHRFRNLEPEEAILKPLGVRVVAAADDDELVKLAAGADALLVTSTKIDESMIAQLRRCQAIVRYGIGVEGVDVDAATRAGIPVGNVVDASVAEVADHTLAAALSLLRRLDAAASLVASGGWSLEPVRGVRRLSDLTVGIVGLGRIGREVATRFEAFGPTVIAHDPFVSHGRWPLVLLDELLTQADVVTVHMPLTDDTRNLISRERLARLRSTSILVNVARGGIVDEVALAEALVAGQLSGAAVDVYEVEPLAADHPLRQAPNTILTPHVAWYSEQSLREVQRKAAEQVARALRGEPLDPIVNPAVYTNPSKEAHA